MAWIARLAFRRVVWIVVGLVVYAALSAAGVASVRAASGSVVSDGGTVTSGSCDVWAWPEAVAMCEAFGSQTGSALLVLWDVADADAVDLVGDPIGVSSAADGMARVWMVCWSTGQPSAFVNDYSSYVADATPQPYAVSQSSAYRGLSPGPGTCGLVADADDGFSGSFTVSDIVGAAYYPSTYVPTPTPAPTATPSVVPSPSASPVGLTVVALSAEDRARLDDSFEFSVYGTGVLVALLTAVVVTVGLRR